MFLTKHDSARLAVCVVAAAAVSLSPHVRHLAYSLLIPLALFFVPVRYPGALHSRRRALFAVGGVVILAVVLHWYNDATHPVHIGEDSRGYIDWARQFAAGKGFPGMIYRPPLYSFVLGLVFKAGGTPATMVLLQRLVAIVCIPLVYWLGRAFSLGRRAAVCAALLFAVDSLTMQMARYIMTEILFVGILLVSLLSLVWVHRSPSMTRGVVCGILFSVCAHCRQLATSFLALGLVLVVLRWRRRAIVPVTTTLLVFAGLNAPWSIRNYAKFGTYGLSSHLGLNIFTKLSSYRLEYEQGKAFQRIEPVYKRVLEDLGLEDYEEPHRPEDAWQVNRIPHVLRDSLSANHGYSFAEASRLLVAVSIEGFLHHPGRYIMSIGKAFGTMVFRHREMYPTVEEVLPVPETFMRWYPVRTALRGLVCVPAILGLLLPLVVAFGRYDRRTRIWVPWALFVGGYLTTAAIQVGFTRYTTPWTPFRLMCAAVVLDWVSRQIQLRRPEVHK